jgi:hypothetical protein
MIPDLSFRDWRILCGVPPTPIEDFPFMIVIEGGMLAAVSGIVQPGRKG